METSPPDGANPRTRGRVLVLAGGLSHERDVSLRFDQIMQPIFGF